MWFRRKPIYADYMLSPDWARRKRRYYQRHRKRCRACRATERIHLHHKTYKRLGREWDRDLVPLCEDCHARVHTTQKLTRGNLELVTNAYIKAARRWWWVGG